MSKSFKVFAATCALLSPVAVGAYSKQAPANIFKVRIDLK